MVTPEDSNSRGDSAEQEFLEKQRRMLLMPETRDQLSDRNQARSSVHFDEAQSEEPPPQTLAFGTQPPDTAGGGGGASRKKYDTSLLGPDPTDPSAPAGTSGGQGTDNAAFLQKIRESHGNGSGPAARPGKTDSRRSAAGTGSPRRSGMIWGVLAAAVVLLAATGFLLNDRSAADAEIALEVNSTPQGATILLDGVDAGKQTPAIIRTTSGKHQIGLQHDGFETQTIEVSLAAGENADPIEAELAAVASVDEQLPVSIASNPAGAAIFIDGEDMQRTTPVQDLKLAPGTYQLELKREGFDPMKQELVVGASGIEPLDLALTETDRTSLVTIESDPPGATVTVDGKQLPGKTPLKDQELPAGTHRLLVSLDGYEPEATSFELTGDPFQLRLKLGKTSLADSTPEKPAKLKELKVLFNSRPAGAFIEIDGKPQGQTPAELNLTPGVHAVRLHMDGHEPVLSTSQVDEAHTAFSFNLEQRTSELQTDLTVRDFPEYLPDSKKLLVGTAVRRLLTDAWDANTFQGLATAREQYDYARELCNLDLEPRISFAYGLVLYQHRQMKEALQQFDIAADRGRARGYLAPARMAIRIRTNLGGENGRVAQDCLDLVRQANRIAASEGGNRDILSVNLRFAGLIFGFLEGPKGVDTRGRIAFDKVREQVKESLKEEDWYYFSDAVAEIQSQFSEQMEIRAQQMDDDLEREKHRILAGVLATSETVVLRHDYTQSDGRSAHGTGNWGRDVFGRPYIVGSNFGVRGVDRGYAQGSRNDRYTRTTRTDHETFTRPRRHRAFVLMTYLPVGLESERAELISTFPAKYEVGRRRYD